MIIVAVCLLCAEMGRQLLLSYMECDRIFASQRNESGGKDYYVKWRNLAYSEATWEDEFNITNYYAEALDRYNQRLKTSTNPRSYASAMKNVSSDILFAVASKKYR